MTWISPQAFFSYSLKILRPKSSGSCTSLNPEPTPRPRTRPRRCLHPAIPVSTPRPRERRRRLQKQASKRSLGAGPQRSAARRHEETLALIEAYRDRWEALRKGNLRAADWDDVAGAVTARCGRFPTATHKSGVQCRHKVEKLRKRYRAKRARTAGRSKGPKWPFFQLLHDLVGGGAPDPSPNPIVKIKPKGTPAPASPSPVSSPSSEEAVRSRSLHGLISNGGGGSGLRFTIPKVARTKPVVREARAERSEEGAEAEAMAEVASALQAVGEGFLRVEERRLQMTLQMEKERMESEMKRTQTLLDAQQLFVEAFLGKQQHKKAKGVSSAAAAMDED